MKITFEIDGNNFSDINGFYAEFSEKVLHNKNWGHNLDAFNDVLRGGFGTPDDGFILIWNESSISKENLKEKYDTLVEIIREHKKVNLVLK